MYEFPVHDCTQEQNGSPYFSPIVRRYKWPSFSRKIVEIQKFCYHGNLTSRFPLILDWVSWCERVFSQTVKQWACEAISHATPCNLLKAYRLDKKSIIIQSKFFFLFVGREPTTWPANNCLQIMVCSCAMPSNCFWLQIIFCTCVKETVLFSFLRSLLRENGRSLRFPRIFIKKTNSVIEWLNNYWTRLWQNIVICQCLADQLFASAFGFGK